MKPINIDIKSPVDMAGELIYMDKPMFEKKNTLAYQGMASNLTYKSGVGMLSTTGKEITVDNTNRKVEVGSQTISVPEGTFTVTNRGEVNIGNDSVSIKGYVATKSSLIDIEGNVIAKDILTDCSDVRVCPIDNLEEFVWVGIDSDSKIHFYNLNIEGEEGHLPLNSTYTAQSISNYTSLGEKITATYVEYSDGQSNLIIGLDDNDYRKRICFVYRTKDSTHSFGYYRGFGCVSSSGVVVGEPIIKARYEQILYNKTTTTPLTDYTTSNGGKYEPDYIKAQDFTVLDGDSISFTDDLGGPDVFNNPRYNILGNGVISVWTAFVPYSDPSASTNMVTNIVYKNNHLGEYKWGSDTQEGYSNYQWKLANQLGQFGESGSGSGTLYYDTDKSRGYDVSNSVTFASPDNGVNFWYGGVSCASSSSHYLGKPIDLYWHYQYGIDFSYTAMGTELSYSLYNSGVLESSEIYNNEYCKFAGMNYHILGDWTYLYDSFKSVDDLTDYDSIFPCLRLFFNNTTTRGKYYDYGKGWFKCYHFRIGIRYTKQQLFVVQKPLLVLNDVFTNNKLSRRGISYYATFQQGLDAGTRVDEAQIQGLYNEQVVEPIGKVRYLWSTVASTSQYNDITQFTPNNPRVYTTNDGTDIEDISDYTSWYYYYTQKGGTSSTMTSNCMYRIIEKGAAGEGLKEPGFNFLGYDEDSILSMLDYSTDISPDKSDSIRLQVHDNMGMAISCNGTLLFNAYDYEDKFWIKKSTNSGNTVYDITIYVNGKAQYCKITKNGRIEVDKLSDYMFRVNTCSKKNLIKESKKGIINIAEGFKAFIGENVMRVAPFELSLPTDTTTNANLYFGEGINVNLSPDKGEPSFLFPAKTFEACYIATDELEDFEDSIIKERKPWLSDKLRYGNWTDKIEVFSTISNATTDILYKYSVQLPSIEMTTTENYTGVQSEDSDLTDNTYYIDSDTVIYPVALSSSISGKNYVTSTISLPGGYAVRFYRNNNDTWCAYMSSAQVYYGSNIFTIMGSNYYFDGQGIYYLGSEQSGTATTQYSSNVLITYALGLEYLCCSPSEAFFYSPFDRCLYLFTSSNTMQKSDCLAGYGDIIDSCYCSVNQALYILFKTELYIKTQDDSALIPGIEYTYGTELQSTEQGIQILNTQSSKYTIFSLYLYEDEIDLDIETDWLGNTNSLSKYSYADITFYKDSEKEVDVKCDFLTMANETVSSNERTITIKPTDFKNNLYRLRISPKEPIGNAFKVIVKSTIQPIGVVSIDVYMDTASVKNSAGGHI